MERDEKLELLEMRVMEIERRLTALLQVLQNRKAPSPPDAGDMVWNPEDVAERKAFKVRRGKPVKRPKAPGARREGIWK